jgi:hypothetical protein
MGHQETVEEMRAEKAEKYIELKDKRNSVEYEEWFLRYRPLDNKNDQGNDDKSFKKINKTKNNIKKKRKTRKRKGFFF